MTNFLKAVTKVLEHEGGFVDHPDDRGGATNYGITQKVYESFIGRPVTTQEMRIMPKGNAVNIYKENYWDKVKGDLIKSYSKAYILFDQAVNRGPNSAVKQAQRIIGATVDGAIGPQTIKMLNAYSEKKFIDQYLDKSKSFYNSIVSRDPSQAVFLKGWMNRVESLQTYAYKNRNKFILVTLLAGGLATAYTLMTKKKRG